MRVLKYTGIVVLVLVLALLIAPFVINVDHYRAQIEQKVHDATGRALHIGSMQASLFPWVGLKLEDVTFANADGFEAPFFLKVGRLDVKLAVMPLLQKKIELQRFELDAPELHLQRNRDGVGNWEDLMAKPKPNADAVKPEPAAPSAGTSPLMAGFVAETIQLTHGQLSWQDDRSGQKIRLNDVQLALLDVQQSRPVTIRAAVAFSGDTVSLEGKVGPIGDVERFQPERLPVQLSLSSKRLNLAQFSTFLPELPAILGSVQQAAIALDTKLEQHPDGSRAVKGSFTLDAAHDIALKWEAEQIDLQHILLKSADLAWDGTMLLHSKGRVALPADAKPDIEMQITSEKISRTWLTSLLPQLDGLYGKHPAPWTDLDVGMVVQTQGDVVNLRDMKVHLNQELLTLSGQLQASPNPDIRLRVKADQLHLDPWLPFSEDQAAQGGGTAAPASPPVEPDLRSLTPWKLNVQLNIGQLVAKGLVLDRVAMDLQSDRGSFHINPLSFAISGGQVSSKVSLKVADYPVSWQEAVTVTKLEVGPLLKQFANSDQLAGTANLNSNLHGAGLLPNAIKSSMTGQISMEMLNGKVKGFDIAQALRNITSAGNSKEAKYTDFAQLQASFVANQGVLSNDDLFMASPLFRLTGHGTINLPASTMDYHMRPKLVATLVGQGDQASNRSGLVVPLHIAGPFDAPSISPDLTADTVVSGVQDALQGGNPLKALGQNAVPATAPADAVNAAKDKVNKTLGGLIPGF